MDVFKFFFLNIRQQGLYDMAVFGKYNKFYMDLDGDEDNYDENIDYDIIRKRHVK